MRYFSVASLVAILTAAVVLGLFYRYLAINNLKDSVESSNLTLTRVFSNFIQRQYGPFMAQASQMPADALRSHGQTARFHRKILYHVRNTQVLKVKIFDPQGKTLYSSESSQIGRIKPKDYPGRMVARTGIVVSTLKYRQTFNAIKGSIQDRHVVSTYFPIRRHPGGKINGVVEVYTDVTDLYREIQRKQILVIAVVVLILMLLYAALFLIVRRASDLLESQSTRRKEAEAESARLGRILEDSSNEIYTFDAESLRFVQVNRGARENLGYTMAELRQLTPLDLKPKYTQESFEALVRPLRDGYKQQVLIETVHRRKDGSEYPVEVRLQLSRADKHPVFAAIIQDMTERKHVQQELQRANEIFRGVLEAAPDAVIIVDQSGHIVLANQYSELVFGYTREELFGQSMEQLVPGLLRQRHAAVWEDFMRRLKVRRIGEILKLQARRKNGKKFPVEISLSYFKSHEGLLMIAIVRDVSEQQEAEQKLKWLASFPEMNPYPVIEVNRQGQVSYVNPIGRELFPDLMKTGLAHPLISVIQPLLESHDEGDAAPLLLDTVLDNKTYQLCIKRVPGDNKFRIYVWDITIMHHMAQELSHQASHDALTGLVNRHEFEIRLDRALISARNENKQHAVLYLDLDQFKTVNDTCGHIAGDALLKQLTVILQGHVRHSDILARLGGDEFGLLLQFCPLEKAMAVAEEIRQAIGDYQFIWEQWAYKISTSIGVVAINAESADLAEVMSVADSACYVAKEAGRNRVHAYQSNVGKTAQLQGEMRWIPRIRKALEENRFQLYCQKIMPLKDNVADIVHYEILVRMLDEQGDMVLPMAFIPAAERYNLMPAIDRWVIHEALEKLQTEARFIGFCAINLSGQSFCDEQFLHFVTDQIKQTGIDPKRLCFEITETAAIANLTEATRFIDTLHEMGCLFALDDFGSGLSSFAYLRTLPVDFLKIDGSFVKNILTDTTDLTVVQFVNQFGHAMGMKTIAEFVESAEILAILREMGIDYAQGYGIEKPQPLDGDVSMAAEKRAKG